MRPYTRRTLSGKTIDAHNHAGVSINAYARQEYPYAATIEGIYYRQKACGIDMSVVFPFTPDLYFDFPSFLDCRMRPASRPISPAPYATENELLLREVYDFCPELTSRFLPFVSVDPLRKVAAQCRSLEALSRLYPVYGIKVSGVLCQAPLTAFLKQGRPLLDFARERNWPILFHTTCSMDDCYSNSELAFRVIEARPDLRFALAHAIGFQQQALDRAQRLPNVWIDSAALTIQVKLARDGSNIVAPKAQQFRADYRHPGKVLRALATALPGRMVWGSDTPAYSYICRRRQGGDTIQEFRLKAVYEDEVAALRYLPADLQREVANRNTLDFLFGRK